MFVNLLTDGSYFTFTLILSLVILAGCSDNERKGTGYPISSPALSTIKNDQNGGLKIIKTDQYEGVILEDSEPGGWIPDENNIDDFESELEKYLKKLEKNNLGVGTTYNKSSLSFVIKNIKSYKRQYVGKTIDGKKVLHCNFITLLDDNMRDRWCKEYILILDGGPNFFTVNYDVTNKEYYELWINGLG